MKKLGKLKLNQLSKDRIENREMEKLIGGQGDCSGSCACGCDQQNFDNTTVNRNANNTTYTPYSGFDREDGFWAGDCI
ncbi:MAG: TIGR04149 family rSAM-modified RiPP [Draconibacterium sp.]